MQPQPFPDRREILFGREPDLVRLAARAQQSGVTAVLGRPRMGKTWLLTELARRLSSNSRPNPSSLTALALGEQAPCLVGLSDPEGSTADQMLRAVVDLYARWLSDSTYREQAKIVYEQHKTDWVGKTGEAVGAIFKSIGGEGAKAVGELVKEGFEGLAAANRDLVSGGMQLPRLQSEQARDLLAILHKITSCRIVLIFDQWEKSPNLEMECNILDAFLRHRDDWPPCHIFLGVRFSQEVDARLWTLRGGFKKSLHSLGPMDIFEIPSMHLDKDQSAALIDHLREKVRAATHMSNDQLMAMVAGYPGIVETWTEPRNAQLIDSPQLLQEYADAANENRYIEFDAILPSLEDRERQIAMRLSLIPSCGEAENWKALKSIILDGAGVSLLDKLVEKGVLLEAQPPRYGHPTRGEAACRWFAGRAEFSEICNELVFSLAGEIRAIEPHSFPYAVALSGISYTDNISVSTEAQALLVVSRSILGDQHIDTSKLIGIASMLDKRRILASLISNGLFNTLVYAKEENDLARRDALLEELRTLARNYPDDAVVRENFVSSLVNTLADGKDENDAVRRKTLLEELRLLARTYPDDAAVCERLAIGVFKAENDLARRNELLDELRTLARTHLDDAAVRENLARVLVNMLIDVKRENDLMRRDALLEELRTLARIYADDAAVRKQLARGIFEVLIDVKAEDDLTRRNELLDELRTLARTYTDDTAVREQLAKGLFNTFIWTKQENDLARHGALLDELRMLANASPENVNVLQILKKAQSLG